MENCNSALSLDTLQGWNVAVQVNRQSGVVQGHCSEYCANGRSQDRGPRPAWTQIRLAKFGYCAASSVFWKKGLALVWLVILGRDYTLSKFPKLDGKVALPPHPHPL